MTGYSRERVSFVFDMFDLLQTNDCSISVRPLRKDLVLDLLSTLRRIFNAKTFCFSFGDPAKRDSHTRAKVPRQMNQSKLAKFRRDHTSSNSFDQFKVSHSQLFRRGPNLFAARIFRNLAWRKRGSIALEACNKIFLFLLLFLINWLFIGQVATVGAEQFMAVRSVEVGFELCGCHLDAQQAKSSWKDAWGIFEIGNGLRWQDCRRATSFGECIVGGVKLDG